MTSVRKSPNMMSTTGRIPVIAAPTPRPVNPASEIGVSMTREGPNSCTRPARTLKAVPASATSSPISTSRGSRRISSAIASLTASANVSSRVAASASGIHVLSHFRRVGIRRIDRPAHRMVHLARELGVRAIKHRLIREPFGDQVRLENRDRITLLDPMLLFLLRAVILPADVADVVTAEAIRVGDEERRTAATPGAVDQRRRGAVDGANVLTVDTRACKAECRGPRHDFAGGRLAHVRVLVVVVVLAHVDHRQRPQLREVHRFVQHALAERPFAEEADNDA